MDQCKHCTCRGDIEKCEKVECSFHESWYAQTIKAATLPITGKNRCSLCHGTGDGTLIGALDVEKYYKEEDND